MMTLTLREVAVVCGGRLDAVDDHDAAVTGVVIDSRQVAAGALFVAVAGERVDGHDFAAAAAGAGAVAVLAARPVGVPAVVVADPVAALAALAAQVRTRSSATVVAVTGSAGKTTTKDLLADLLGELGPTVAAAGSFNNEIGLPLTVTRIEPATRFAVLEMGARGPGHIAALCELARPRIGVVLNVGSAHLGQYADGRAGIARAKGELAEAASDAVVLNADDPLVAGMAARARGEVITFGEGERADVRAHDVRVGDDGRARFDLVAAGERHPVALTLVGEHQVGSALAAAAVAIRLGLPPARAAEALSRARARSRWRMEVAVTDTGVTVINDAYNANPESMRAALKTLVDLSRGRRAWAVLGGMEELGASADDEHDALGRLVVRLGVEQLVAIGERARRIHLGASLEGSWSGESVWVADVEQACTLLREQLVPGDVVLVKASRAFGLERVASELTSGAVSLGATPLDAAPGEWGAHG
ncbi:MULTISPECIES: UDP-N-acetylmuramoyl-tripeptide--D-alanyl-D-alanine ligase [Protofrankia]|uniref:UDP-N-acetylmuramoyl-tripeptide--D-alanyl-D-alanine ligase n=1 Tax=Candidatus Protofrankia datiscae TaxID=2716812 RepID=F8AYC1_9ACTN|nr:MULTISPECIES: UDP-N-acetylmuramoyl-tripeptide--D-alanyl-D-alanine ligase [Protofrankia]AEH10424.1 UDP-N-acetylmuramoylalanyl-D-glutamyl-2,6-diaminopimelate/D-alanyl-D-alanyl ligase [Candidatus Protofrankia datiscae]